MTVETPQAWDIERADAIIASFRGREGPLLPTLHALQEVFGCVPEQAAALLAERLNLSRAEVHGVVTFYPDFLRRPSSAVAVRLCRAEACQSRGGVRQAEILLDRLGLPSGAEWGGTTADGMITIEPVYCLGLCAVAPAALVDGEPLGRLDGATLARRLRR
jgi:formate dehydrogenase subunit gamma